MFVSLFRFILSELNRLLNYYNYKLNSREMKNSLDFELIFIYRLDYECNN